MKVAPLPADEEERLAALADYRILDTASESIFDSITALAAKVCGVPICLISLIDSNRQWFKSNYGLHEATESPRDIAFCSHAILDSKLMEVPDASKDERFFDNPFVLENPNIRFYAGMPLVNPKGFKLGTLCVIDRIPKNLTADQKEILEHLSKIVISFFEVKKALLQDIDHRKKAAEALAEANTKLKQKLHEQKQSHQELILLSEMSSVLQACITEDEAYTAITKFSHQLFPSANGQLHLINGSHDEAECVAAWGDADTAQHILQLNDCWALRRGQIHVVDHPESDLLCKHMQDSFKYICTPLMAQGETLGLLSLIFDNKTKAISETQRLLAQAMAEQMGLALANIKLRETLHQQSIHDPLTGLFNRRYLADNFKRELAYATKKELSLSVMLIDIDYFKRFNDTYGHDLGDCVLREVAQLLLKNTDADDLVCRYGGEEFIVLMPNASLDKAEKQAAQIQSAIKKIKIQHEEQCVNNITLSIGIASFPDHGDTTDKIINAADKALYQAKETGRNKIVIFDTVIH